MVDDMETTTDPATIRATADEREREPVDAPGAVVVQLQAELADVRHLLRLRSDALARVAREAEALRAKVAAVEDETTWLYAHHDGSLVTSDYPMIARRITLALATTGEGK